MKIEVKASTKPGYVMPKEEAILFSGRAAGICYMRADYDTLCEEDPQVTFDRAEGNLESGHHSVYGHPKYTLVLENIPKILAMILNNEKVYDTSEKSARYTKMTPSPDEKVLYEKWIGIFEKEIKHCYPKFDDKNAHKLAMENARYLISVFTPATTMEYTVGIQQWSYIIDFAEKYIKTAGEDPFSRKVKEVLREFLACKPDIDIEGLDSGMKNREFSLFAKRHERQEEWGENYCTTYLGSFAQLAQAQRHRTLSYEMVVPLEKQFFVPPIIEYTPYEDEWKKDIESLKDNYPQGMLVQINERGTCENFVLKCTERLCGFPQYEIMMRTNKTMHKYVKAVENTNPDVYDYLEPYSHGPRCTFPGWTCPSPKKPCIFGPSKALDRCV